ncbi:uncharacterized protein LOC142330291 [Lycorma delicatula]|uniref:uncharacterized protein LOC142330291 n=1 Tax=Lycorma delicatula TaxID=130591 RepID=UPI003F513C6B
MEGFGQPENTKERRPWTTEMMKENRDKWNLAADVGVLEYLQEFGNNLLNETETTINLLDSFEAELNTSCVQVSNITNRFLSLADSQFVENRVYDDEETPTPENATAMLSEPVKTKQEIDTEIFNRLKESINNGLNVLNTKFETVEVTNSDSEDDDSSPTGVVYKPINLFNSRPLPHLIGSVEFMKDPTLGLEEPLTEDEEESVEESSSDSKELLEENEDSEPESDRPNILPKENHNEESDILFKQPSSSFADHLAKRLESMEKESVVVEQPKQTRNLFSTTPPPLDDSYEDDDDFCSSNDLIFGGSRNKTDNRNASSDDLFAPKSKSGFWNDDNDNITTQDNYNHKKVMEDLEKRLSRPSKNDDYNDLSPSPPPLNDQITSDIHDGTNKVVKKKDSSIFDDYNDNLNESDSNDLFSSKNVSSLPSSSTKKHVPAGAVNVLGGILKDKHIDIKKQKQNNKLFKSSSSINEESIKNDAIIAKSITSLRRNYDDDDDDDDDASNSNENKLNDDEDDDSLFKSSNFQEKSSSRSSSVKLSESLQDDNLSIKSNRSAGLFDDVLVNTTKKNTIKKTMDDLFRDLNDNGDDDDDDLFSSNANVININKNRSSNSNLLPSSNKSNTNYTSSLLGNKSTVDDLFSDIDGKDMFSNFVDSKNKEILSETKNNKHINNLKTDSVINTNIKKPNNKPISLFDDDDDIESFDSGFLTTNKNISSSNDSKKINNKTTKGTINGDKPISVPPLSISASTGTTVKNGLSLFDNKGIDLFGDNINDEDDDLFSSDLFSKKSTASKNVSDENSDSLFSSLGKNKNALPLSSSSVDDDDDKKQKQNENDLLSNKNISEENKLVGSSSESMCDKILVVPNKIIKTANVKSLSLFSDDVNDDDLFSNNNNLSKIPEIKDAFFNTTTTTTSKEGTEKVDKKQLSSEINDKLSLKVDDNSEADFKSKDVLQNKTLNEEDNDNNDLFRKSDDFSSKSNMNKTKSDPLLDDSPLFNEDKFIKKSVDKMVTQRDDGVDNGNDNLFGKSTDNSKINIINSDKSDKVSSKIISDELFSTNTDINSEDMFMNAKLVVKQLDSEDLIDKKTADSVPSIFNTTSENLLNVDLVSDKIDVISSTDVESSLETDVNKKIGNDNSSSSFDNKNVTTDSDSSENLFDVNKSLPKIPSVANKKPQIPVKPTKPQPPKSLNIRAPISSPDAFGDMIKNKSSTNKSLDVPDGCVFSSDSSSTISPKITPGKLNLEKTLNIDPKALLPGARPASFKRSSNSSSIIKENDNGLLKSSSSDLFNNENLELNDDKTSDKEDKMSSLPDTKDTQPVLHSIAKDRAKIQVKRRPQTRKARREAIRQSTIESNNDDETDNSSSITTTTTTQSVKEQKSTSSSLFEQTSNILSPSTDEEDLFGVPPLDLPPDYSKVSTSPGDIFDAPTIISPGLNTSVDDTVATSLRTVSSNNDDGDDDYDEDKSKKEDNNIVSYLSGSKNDNFEDGICDKNSDIVIEPPPLLIDSDYDDDVKDVGKSFKNHPDELFSDSSNISAGENKDIFKSNSIKVSNDGIENKGTDFSTSNKSLSTKSNSDINLFDDNDDDSNLFLNKKSSVPDKVNNVISDSILKDDNTNKDNVNTDLVKPDPANIICGVFNTGVNICDKLSITPPNDDELFPPSDWTLNNSNKGNTTIISVPEKIKTDSLFNDNISDDNLFSSSSLNATIANARSSSSKVNSDKGVSNMEKKNVMKKPVVGDLFAKDDDDDDDDDDDNNLFGEVKTKNEMKPPTNLKIKKPLSIKTKSLFDEDDDGDDDEIDIFSSSVKNKSSLTKNKSNEVKSSGLIKKIGSNVKTSVKVTAMTGTSKTTPQDGFIDPLMALEKNND